MQRGALRGDPVPAFGGLPGWGPNSPLEGPPPGGPQSLAAATSGGRPGAPGDPPGGPPGGKIWDPRGAPNYPSRLMVEIGRAHV